MRSLIHSLLLAGGLGPFCIALPHAAAGTSGIEADLTAHDELPDAGATAAGRRLKGRFLHITGMASLSISFI